MKRVFLYNIDEEKRVKIALAALRCGLVCVTVPPEDFSRPVGCLLGDPFPEGEEAVEASFTGEMLLMEELDGAFLDGLRQLHATVPLKAVVTEQNRTWTSAALHRELTKEHEAMRKLTGQRPVHKKRR